jgi:hypothetical protein
MDNAPYAEAEVHLYARLQSRGSIKISPSVRQHGKTVESYVDFHEVWFFY